VISQSLTIARFLAKEFGLAGKTNLEQAQADMIIDAGNDLANSESHRPHF
jgi:glutathione S-transferase